MRARVTALVVAVGLVAGGLALAWGSSTGSQSSSSQADLRFNLARTAGGYHRPYTRLAEMLPNAVVAGETSGATDSVVVGTIRSAVEEAGFIESGQPSTAGAPGATRTTFDDPKADWRTLRVTVAVEEVLAGERVEQLVLDWSLRGNNDNGEDAAAVARELKALGRVVLLSKALPAGPEFLGMRRTLPDPPLGVAVVGADESLAFPFADVTAAAFLDGIDTVEELRAQAQKPTWTRTLG